MNKETGKARDKEGGTENGGKKSQINFREIQSVLNGFCFLTKKCVQTCKAMYKLNPWEEQRLHSIYSTLQTLGLHPKCL